MDCIENNNLGILQYIYMLLLNLKLMVFFMISFKFIFFILCIPFAKKGNFFDIHKFLAIFILKSVVENINKILQS